MKLRTALILAIATIGTGRVLATPADDRVYATRVTCELQTAGAQSMPALTFAQGTTPKISLDQFRAGKSVDATNSVTAVFYFGPTLTNQYFVVATNYATSGNGYLVQLPSIGTNATGWAYTAILYRDGYSHWTGNGRLTITPSTVTGDSLVWQSINSQWLYVATNRTVTINGQNGELSSNLVFTVTTATAGYSDWSGNSSNALKTVVVTGAQSNLIATAVQVEADTNAIAQLDAYTDLNNASVASLFTLISTGRVERVWESTGSNAWYTAESNVLTRWEVGLNKQWFCTIAEHDEPENFGPTNFWTDIPYPVSAGTWIGATIYSGDPLDVFSAPPFPSTAWVGSVVDTNETSFYLAGNTTAQFTYTLRTNRTDYILSSGSYYGDGSGLTNVNAALLGGYTLDEIMAVGATNISFAGTVDATAATYVRVPDPVNGDDAVNFDTLRAALSIGDVYYATTNRAATAFSQSAVVWSTKSMPAYGSVTANVASNNQYVLAIMSPAPVYGTLQGPAAIDAWLSIPAGAPAANYAMSVKAELYYTYETNNHVLVLGDWQGASQTLTPGQTNLVRWSIPFPNTAVTGAWVVASLKVTSKGSSANTITLHVGTNYASFTQLRTPAADSLGSRGATNLVFSMSAASPSYAEATRTFTLPAYQVGSGVTNPISVSTLPVFVKPSTNVYYTAVSAVSVLSNDVSALNLNGSSLAKWTWRVDCTATQALYSTWAANIVWDCPPEMTCTGLYVFAMSSVDGVTITGKQTWPDKSDWQYGGVGNAAQTVGTTAWSSQFILLANSETVDWIEVQRPVWCPAFVEVTGYSTSDDPLSEPTYVTIGISGPDVGANLRPDGWTSNRVSFAAYHFKTKLYAPLYNPTSTKHYEWAIGLERANTVGLGSLVLQSVKARKANALERAAADAGGFPAAFKLD